jgi:transposase-like protein
MDTLGAVRYTKAHMPKDKLTEAMKTAAAAPPAPVPQTKRYDDAFKRQAVEHWIKSGQRGTQIARDLGVSYPALKQWKRRYHGDATPVRAQLEAENRALKAELARVREPRDILKTTLGILSEPPKNATNASKP